MKFSVITRDPDHLKQTLTAAQIELLCESAFGSAIQLEVIQELEGGTFYNTYLIQIATRPRIILRVAPAKDNPKVFQDEAGLMRREYMIQPFFASVAGLMPKTILADFTHQLIDRDYLFQTFMSGKPWADLKDKLPAAQTDDLWRQVGRLLKTIHRVKGDTFGDPGSAVTFSTWGAAVVHSLSDIIHTLKLWQIDAGLADQLLHLVECHMLLFDEVTEPRLLHQDIWLQNILVQRSRAGAKVSAILDSDRATWGDPLSDWTIVRLGILPVEHTEGFWVEYGQPDPGFNTQLRLKVYQARSLAYSLHETKRNRNESGHQWVHQKLVETVDMLNGMVS